MALSLQGCHYLYDAELIFILRTTPHVVHLDVGGCVELYDQSGVYIAEHLSQLKTLNMSCTKIKNETMSALAEHHADTLQALNISDCWGVEPDALCKVLQKCTNLRVLHACAWTVKNCYETFPDVLQHVAYLTLDVFCENGSFDYLARLPTVCNNLQYFCLSGLENFAIQNF